MVNVRGSLRFAFSTVYGPHDKIDAKDLKLDARMFPGFQEQKILKIDEIDKLDELKHRPVLKAIKKFKKRIADQKEKLEIQDGSMKVYIVKKRLTKKGIKIIEGLTQIDNLGDFLERIENDPESIAKLTKIKSKEKFLECIKMGRKSFELFKTTIQDPTSIVKTAIFQCFELFQITKKNIKEYTSEDSEKLFIDDNREFSISYLKNDNIKEIESLEGIEEDKKNGFEIKWFFFDITNNRWLNLLSNAIATATTSILKYLIPRITGMAVSFIDKKIKTKSDELLTEGVNLDIKLIFYLLLRANLAVDSIKFQRFEAEIWDEAKKKKLLKEFGTKLLKNSKILNE